MEPNALRAVAAVVPAEGAAGAGGRARSARAVAAARGARRSAARLSRPPGLGPRAARAQGIHIQIKNLLFQTEMKNMYN